MVKFTMLSNSTPNYPNNPIPPVWLQDVLTGSPAVPPSTSRDIRPVTGGTEKAPDHSAIFVRKCVVTDANYPAKETERLDVAPQNSMTDAETDDLLDLLLAGVVNIRARQEKIEADSAARNAELNAELNDLYDCFIPDSKSRRADDAYAELLISQNDKAATMTVADYIDACSRKGVAFADGTKVSAILSLCYEDDNPAIAGQAFRCENMLILSLPSNVRAADICVRMLIINAENTCYLPLPSRGERNDATGSADIWTVTYQQIFDRLFEVSPFADPITPGTPFAIQIIPNRDAKYCSAPCLLRDRATNDLLAWIREGYYDDDLLVIHKELAAAREKQAKEREHYRQESAWEMIQWLASEELSHEYNMEGRAILVEEVGPERAEAMWSAAKTIASLFPLFLMPRSDQPF